MSYPVIHIANKVVASVDPDIGELITNLKLQKMLYYLQGFFIAVFDRKLFDEPIEAWQYGPVVRPVYDHFKGHKAGGIEITEDAPIAKLTEEEEELFNEVLEVYGQFSAVKLMQMTHEEAPWLIAFKGGAGAQSEITYDALKSYFKTQLVSA